MQKLRACKGNDPTYWMPTSMMPKVSEEEVSELLGSLGDWMDEIKEVDVSLRAEAEQDETTPKLPPVRGEGETLAVGRGIKAPDNTPAPRKLSAEEVAAQKKQPSVGKAG